MKLEELQPGTRLELELFNNTDEKTGYTYVSQVLEPVKGTDVIIYTPIFEARLVYIPMSCKLRITFFHRKYGLIGFTAAVEARENRGNISALKLRALSEPEKIQRRQHYRLDCLLASEYRVLGGDGNSDKKPLIKTTVKNISGAGACILTDENLPEKTLLELYVNLGNVGRIKATCIILRNQPVEVKKGKSYELGLYFAEISKRDQDLIIKYIFEQQRVLLKKDVLEK